MNPEPNTTTPTAAGSAAAAPPPAATPPAQTTSGEPAGDLAALPDWAREQITRANAQAANYRTRLRDAEQRLDGAKTADDFKQAVAEVKADNNRLEHELLRERVARRFELPDDLAARLQGKTAEELEADAKALQKYATPAPAAPGTLAGGLDPTDDGDTETDPRELARRYGGRRR
ncbi:hypothetical protein [Paractinoplanes rishiriensis]|uniref:hypothetical protein n=1 Tax=Paractinoplanes rishiriensis TaxID=1050105 RepID=UPI001941E1A7|nr:hypothetical protein [Actinoplanes rishiriensis]